jgi:hypothetical protein
MEVSANWGKVRVTRSVCQGFLRERQGSWGFFGSAGNDEKMEFSAGMGQASEDV